jgi:RimK family alpha-L-glutamate ligase
LRFAVIAQRPTPTNVALATCATPDVESMLLTPAQALVRLEPGDVALGRLDVLYTLDGVEPGFWALDQIEHGGVRLLNPPRAVVSAHDKLRTAEVLVEAGLPHPRTAPLLDGTLPAGLDLPVVIKPPYGSWGHEVTLCRREADLARHLEELQHRPWFHVTGAVVQELVPPLGHDLRLVVAGRRVVGAIERVALPGEWRTNVALGGVRRPVTPPPRACELAIAAAAALGIDLVGVDLLPTSAGEYTIVELNGAADFTSEYNLEEDVFAAAVAALIGSAEEPELEAVAGAEI